MEVVGAARSWASEAPEPCSLHTEPSWALVGKEGSQAGGGDRGNQDSAMHPAEQRSVRASRVSGHQYCESALLAAW